MLGGEAAKAPWRVPFAEKPNGTHWNARSVGLKMAGGALVAAVLAGSSVLETTPPPGAAPSLRTPGLLVGQILFFAIAGALAGYCLALRDLVLERRLRGQRVHPVMRAYFSWGVVSLVLWCVTVFAAGIAGIVFYYSFLSPGVGPATR
jgi:hypothetical protein